MFLGLKVQAKQQLTSLFGCLLLTYAGFTHAEQMQAFGDYEVHYIVVPTTFLQPEVARQYSLTRSRNRALVNVSVLLNNKPVQAKITGESKNLLSQIVPLSFSEVREGSAIYYLAEIRHADEEVHRITLNIQFDDGTSGEVQFQQRLYHED